MKFTQLVKQIVNSQTLEALKKSISKSISDAAPYIQAVKENQVKILGQKFSDLNDWYMKMTGLDKVHLAQEKVTALQGQLLYIQEKRRDVGRQLAEIRSKSIELQDETHKVKRQDDLERFLDLMKKETEILKLEKSISRAFQEYDQTERELFTAFTDSIRDSHEKQRAQMEYTKYIGIILSIAGSFLAFVYSSIRKNQLRRMLDEHLQNLLQKETELMVARHVAQLKMQLLTTNVKGSSNSGEVNNETYLKVSSEFDQFLENNSTFLKVFGVIFGLCLMSKLLS